MALISDGAIMPGINVTKLENLKIVVPPVPLQRDFTDRCSRSPVEVRRRTQNVDAAEQVERQ